MTPSPCGRYVILVRWAWRGNRFFPPVVVLGLS